MGDVHNTEHGSENQDPEKGLNHVEELGQLKSELFGMASHSPVAAPLFAKEVETRWAATKAARYMFTHCTLFALSASRLTL
jgi:hypothetical protein